MNRMKKQLISFIVILAMVLSLLIQFHVTVSAAGGGDATTIDVTDTSHMPANVSFSSGVFTISTGSTPTTITVTGTGSNTIAVATHVSNLTLILNDVHITSPSDGKSPIDLIGDASVTIELANGMSNTLDAGGVSRLAGIHVTSGASLTINGTTGSLTATGAEYGAGIGGGFIEPGGNIVINGGNVTAIGCNGAGIGGGYSAAGGTTNIAGGTVTARGDGGVGMGGAGIGGGGNRGAGGTITISGSANITATAGYAAAGIGGGNQGPGGTIAIGGSASVIATGDTGAGIGSGFNATTGAAITITGTPVIMAAAMGGTNGRPAIDAAAGSTGNFINGKFQYTTSSVEYLKCNGHILTFPDSCQYFAFSSAAASSVGAYSDLACTDASFLGSIVTDPAGLADIPLTNGTSVTNVKLLTSSVINIGDSSIRPTNVSFGGNVFTINSSAVSPITVIGTTSTNSIVLASGVSGLTLILNGVSITSPPLGKSPIDLQGTASVTIQLAGGTTNTLDARNADGMAGIDTNGTATVTIKGTMGELYASGGANGAGIGGAGASGCDGGTITIYGGTVTATGGQYGAGIGGAGSSGGDGGHISINGGIVTATGGSSSAGIGGSVQADGGNISISGGTVIASCSVNSGSGIGGGSQGSGGNITISGGTVTATGDWFGAGIGGGSDGSAGNISVTGGTVTAIGGAAGGAGIGGGDGGSGGNITIGSSAAIMAVSTGYSRPAIDAASGSSGNVINAKLDNAISTTDDSFLNCNGNVLRLPANYSNFAFYSSSASEVNVYSNLGCSALLGNIVTNPAGASSIPVIDLSSSPATVTPVKLDAAYTATVTVNKDGSAWSTGTPVMQLSTLNSSLTGAVSGTLASGVYTFTGLDPAKTYYVWDTTGNIYTGKSVTSASTGTTADYYTITLTSGTGISSATGGGTYLGGSNVLIYAAVSTGYSWSGWTQTAGGAPVVSSNMYTIPSISSTISYTANATLSGPAPIIIPGSLPGGTVGTAYSAGLNAVSLAPLTLTWSITAGVLPAGLTLNSGTGVISGTPTTAGVSTFTVRASDSNGSDTQTLTITVNRTYPLTVNLNGGSGSTVSGSYASGTVVSINAGTKSGYTFSGWATSNGGSFANATSAVTTFTMPANSTTITAAFTYNGGGGTPTPVPASANVPVIVDGTDYYIGNVAVEENTATITVDQSEFEKQLADAKQSVVIPVTSDASTVVAQLVVKNVQDMNDKGVPLSVQTGNINYNIPAASIDTEAILSALGATDPSLAPVNLTIRTNVDAATQAIVDSAVSAASVKEIIPAVQFEVSASYNGKTYDVKNFNNFVSRSVEITPEQALQLTTAIVVNPDGTIRHVPTSVYQKDGKWYAQINSLTNSTYTLIFNQMSFFDAKGKWYQSVVNEMGSREIIYGVGNNCFAGDKAITRAEFAAILVRALGLPANGTATFSDVPSNSWYSGVVATAAQYGIVNGIGNNKFAPDAKITREQAMQMIYNASRLTPYVAVTGADNTKNFIDYGTQSAWATDAVNFNINNGFIQGSNGEFNPKSNITRAETAAVVLRLLQKSGLVDVRTT
ncbi:MAG: S-layer homology domain-containing protein [Bacillota bacterium]|nr:S-layer homology domain-containing protein [Bacillota bacterium]